MQHDIGRTVTIEELRQIIKSVKKQWQSLIVHCSAVRDNIIISDFDAIRKFHKSYRYQGNIINRVEANKIMASGKKVVFPWQEIGYHIVIEYMNGGIVIKLGRSLESSGAHCTGQNGVAIGICVVGDFNETEPNAETYETLAEVIELLVKHNSVKLDKVYPHSFFATWKSCPGKKFLMSKLMAIICSKL